mmetsp:Transcript_64835/g.130371  ORF Transcript_64835/g.130371 Transcript_64835/m.130371 type:complete len:220 (+) Transcript_64835:17-676(+)
MRVNLNAASLDISLSTTTQPPASKKQAEVMMAEDLGASRHESGEVQGGSSSSETNTSSTKGVGTSRTATLRLMLDLRAISTDPPDGISAALVDDSNLYLWQAMIAGPEDSAWEGGIYGLELSFDGAYPDSPPKVRFVCDMFHPNIYTDGSLCMDVLKTMWKPVFTAGMILSSIQSLLNDPNTASPANPAAAALLTSDPKKYRRQVRRCAESSLVLDVDE